MLILLLGLAHADRVPEPIAPEVVVDPALLIAHLGTGSPKEQVYAVRELRRQTRRAVGDLNSRDDIRAAEARLNLSLFDAQLAPACMEALHVQYLVAPCADILRALETTASLPTLQTIHPTLSGHRARRVQQTITFLESL